MGRETGTASDSDRRRPRLRRNSMRAANRCGVSWRVEHAMSVHQCGITYGCDEEHDAGHEIALLGDGEVAVLDVEDDDVDARLAREKKRDTRVTVTASGFGM